MLLNQSIFNFQMLFMGFFFLSFLKKLFKVAISFCLIFFTHITVSSAQIYPSGFNQVTVATGINDATNMSFAPDGRLFICEQHGMVRIFKNNELLTTPFISLSVDANGERGLCGIAFDPEFNSNSWVYLYYTLPDGTNNRIIRVKAEGDTANTSTIETVLDLDSLSNSLVHNGGTMKFGKDSTLYVAVGENGNYLHAQNLDTYFGKLLRIAPDGSIPEGNPYTSGSIQRRSIWASGLRNPFTFDIEPQSGKIFVNDVGAAYWEEINDATEPNQNFGWGLAEGNSNNPAYTNPVYTYTHAQRDSTGCAITGGVFFSPVQTNYPAEFVGNYFFMDYCSKWINRITLNGAVKRFTFATELPYAILALTLGPDGNLYFLSRSSKTLNKVVYSFNSPPIIALQSSDLEVVEESPVNLSVSVSGSQPLTYKWYKNNRLIEGATEPTFSVSNAHFADSGVYKVIISNAFGADSSKDIRLTVKAFNAVPEGTIITPVQDSKYQGGETITFSGSAIDKEDGVLPDSAFNWEVFFHHDTHTHPGPLVRQGVKSGSFTIPAIGETSVNVFYRLYMYVRDSTGNTDTSFVDLLPQTSVITLNSQPQGLQLTIDGSPIVTPQQITSVVGMQRILGVVKSQTLDSAAYIFTTWSNGSNESQTISTSADNQTYTAYFFQKGADDKLLIYPSPARNRLFIKLLSAADKAEAKMFDSKGALVSSFNLVGNEAEVNTSQFQNGLYFIVVTHDKQVLKAQVQVLH